MNYEANNKKWGYIFTIFVFWSLWYNEEVDTFWSRGSISLQSSLQQMCGVG